LEYILEFRCIVQMASRDRVLPPAARYDMLTANLLAYKRCPFLT
jgi:hypothetical protein